MNNLYRFFFVFLTFYVPFLKAQSSSHFDPHTNNEFIPILRFVCVPDFCSPNYGASLLGEGGSGNLRGSGTIGILFTPQHQFKIGGEYLAQKLRYAFHTGHDQRWVHQYALGTKYRYVIENFWLQSAETSFSYSHSFSYRLKDKFENESHPQFRRQIAGSNLFEGTLGTTFEPWCAAEISLAASYDSVKYETKFGKPEHLSGVGGIINFRQSYAECVDFNLRAELKRPYNYYEAMITLTQPRYRHGEWVFGVFGGYTQGNSRLPNSTVVGLQVNFTISGAVRPNSTCSPCGGYDMYSMAQWVKDPGVYIPQVLSIADH